MLEFLNDNLCYLDKSLSVMYIELDLSAVFDIIDHQFFYILANGVVFQSLVLIFIKNYLFPGSQQVITNRCLSGDVKVKHGVQERSFLGHLTFSVTRSPYSGDYTE